MSTTIVLITGANRGIGKGLLEVYLQKPNHIIIAANRNPEDETSKALTPLPRAEGTSLVIVKLDSTHPKNASNAIKQLSSLGIDHIDIVIANAGIANFWPKVAEVKVEDIQAHFETNVYGFIRLYQACLPLLKSAKKPLWVTIGSSAGFIENQVPIPNAAYSPSKAVQHWYTKAIHLEEPTITAFAIHPGWVQTDLGNRSAYLFGLEQSDTTIDDSISGLIMHIDRATRESHSGKMFVF